MLVGSSRPAVFAGFTLLELLIVIVIISLLMALIFPAIGGASRNVQAARVRTEITSLEEGLSNFKANFGQYPPSRIVIYEAAAGIGADPSWDTDSTPPPDRTVADPTRSRGIIKTLWPQFDFSVNRDLNADGDTDDAYVLTGAECLLFFLCGVRNAAQDEDTNRDCVLQPAEDINMNNQLDFAPPIGFSKNPANPFLVTGTNRDGPFFEFDVGRFLDLDCDSMYELMDSISGQTKPFIYVSSYDGTGYDNAEVAGSGMTDVYLQQPTVAWKPQTFQIISPGFDFEFGTGGVYDANTADSDLIGARQAERDNITNFQTGMLASN